MYLISKFHDINLKKLNSNEKIREKEICYTQPTNYAYIYNRTKLYKKLRNLFQTKNK